MKNTRTFFSLAEAREFKRQLETYGNNYDIHMYAASCTYSSGMSYVVSWRES